jgi:hypothetical protein
MHTHAGRRLIWPVLPIAVFAVACFGSPDFARARSTATQFARALAAGDTVEMRELSLPEAGKRMVQLRSELPAAYTVFADPQRALVTVSGGGIYGSGAETVFRIPSLRLQSCDGGLELAVVKSGGRQRVSVVRPVPPVGSLAGETCRRALAATN